MSKSNDSTAVIHERCGFEWCQGDHTPDGDGTVFHSSAPIPVDGIGEMSLALTTGSPDGDVAPEVFLGDEHWTPRKAREIAAKFTEAIEALDALDDEISPVPPPCPSWCRYEPGHAYETVGSAGELIRYHAGLMRSLDRQSDSVWDRAHFLVEVVAEETAGRDGWICVSEPRVNVTSESQTLTAADAREAMLLLAEATSELENITKTMPSGGKLRAQYAEPVRAAEPEPTASEMPACGVSWCQATHDHGADTDHEASCATFTDSLGHSVEILLHQEHSYTPAIVVLKVDDGEADFDPEIAQEFTIEWVQAFAKASETPVRERGAK